MKTAQEYCTFFETRYEREFKGYTRNKFIISFVFSVTTYDSSVDDFYARKFIRVCNAITNGNLDEYWNYDDDCFINLMLNLPFFYEKLTWENSIAECEWEYPVVVECLGFTPLTKQPWENFLKGLELFYNTKK